MFKIRSISRKIVLLQGDWDLIIQRFLRVLYNIITLCKTIFKVLHYTNLSNNMNIIDIFEFHIFFKLSIFLKISMFKY